MNKREHIEGLLDLGYDVMLFDVGREEMRTFRKVAKSKGQSPEELLINIIKRYNENAKKN